MGMYSNGQLRIRGNIEDIADFIFNEFQKYNNIIYTDEPYNVYLEKATKYTIENHLGHFFIDAPRYFESIQLTSDCFETNIGRWGGFYVKVRDGVSKETANALAEATKKYNVDVFMVLMSEYGYGSVNQFVKIVNGVVEQFEVISYNDEDDEGFTNPLGSFTQSSYENQWRLQKWWYYF